MILAAVRSGGSRDIKVECVYKENRRVASTVANSFVTAAADFASEMLTSATTVQPEEAVTPWDQDYNQTEVATGRNETYADV